MSETNTDPTARSACLSGVLSGPGILLSEGESLVLRPIRLADRVRARMSGETLDRRLAAGQAPESEPLLAVRARQIVSPRSRRAIAASWERLLKVASTPRGIYSTTVPVSRGQIIATEPAIRELIRQLRAPLPVAAQGAAKARVPLTDLSGPVYNRRADVAIAGVIEDAIAYLDPALPLLVPEPARGDW